MHSTRRTPPLRSVSGADPARPSRAARAPLLALALLLAGCATRETVQRDWSQYDGPGAAYFREEELTLPAPNDPAEPLNRRLDDVKHAGAEYVLLPLADGWHLIVPETVRGWIENVGRNALYPSRLVANLVQGQWRAAGVETERFAVNTTLGVLGARDAATEHGLPAPRRQDMGHALRSLGWHDSAYVSMPAATVRDNAGLLADAYLYLLAFLTPADYVHLFNFLAEYAEPYVRFTHTVYDPYRLERLARVLDRELEPTDEVFEPGAGPAVETLQYVFLGLQDADFIDDCDDREVVHPATGSDFAYRVWLQDHTAPVVYVLPGTGGHRESESTAALAEMAYRAGYHAVAISSAFSWDFVATAGTVDFPGFAPADAHDVHVALTAVDADLRRREGTLIGRRRALLGMSMGGFHALFIAANEDTQGSRGLITFDGTLALNPPVSLFRAARGMDAYFNRPLRDVADPDERERRLRALFRHVLDVAGGGDLRPGRPLPLDDVQAQFLIGLAFRMSLIDVLDQARALGRTGDVLRTPRSDSDRSASYREIEQYSYMEYFHAFVLPEQARRRHDITNDDDGARELARLSDLRSLSYELRRDPRVRIVTNANDVVLDPADVVFLQRTFGTRLRLNESGGHLGNLWRPEVRERAMERLREVVPLD